MKRFLQQTILCLALGHGISTIASAATYEEIASDFRPRLDSFAANSVDTATGAFKMDVNIASLQGGRIPLDFTLNYNSMLTRPSPRSNNNMDLEVVGWAHQYNGNISQVSNEDDSVTIYLAGHLSRYTFVKGAPCIPLDAHNKRDILEFLEEGDLQGLWRLRRPDGTTYLFEPVFDQLTGRLIAILNRNGVPIRIDEDGRTEKIYTVSKGQRQIMGNSDDAPISASLILHYAAYNIPQDNLTTLRRKPHNNINHIEQESGFEFGGIYTYLKYVTGGVTGEQRLFAIYDPVTLRTLVDFDFDHPDFNIRSSGVQEVQFGLNPTLLPQKGHLLRITPDISFSNSYFSIFLISPAGTVFSIGKNAFGDKPISVMTDHFIKEDISGLWTIRIQGDYPRANPGKIKGIKIEEAIQPASNVFFSYQAYAGSERLYLAIDQDDNIFYSNSYGDDGRIRSQNTGIFKKDRIGAFNNLRTAQTTFSYETLPNSDVLTTVFDRTPQKNATTFLHDRNFNLKRVTDPLNNFVEHTYNAQNERISTRDPRGNITTFAYNGSGRLTSITEPGNHTTTFGYDEFERPAIDRINPTSVRTYALETVETDNFTEIPSEGTSKIIIVHDDGKMTRLRIFDAAGIQILDRNSVDLIQSKVDLIEARISTFGSLTPAQEQEIKDFAVDSVSSTAPSEDIGNVTSITDARLHKSTLKYDGLSNLASTMNAAESHQGYFYNKDSELTVMTNKAGRGVEATYDEVTGLPISANFAGKEDEGKDSVPAEQMRYDFFGRVTKMTDSDGDSISFKYDPRGNIIETKNDLNHTETKTYNSLNQLIATEDAEGRITSYTYDINGNQTSITNALLKTTVVEYDEEDRPIKTTDPSGASVVTEYDAAGRVSKVIDQEGNPTTYKYDAAGNRTEVRRGGKLISTIAYNALGLPISTTNGHGKTISYFYDELGQEIAVVDPSLKTTTSRYDELGRLDQVKDPLNRVYEKSYDANDTVSGIKDSGGNETRFTYTGKNNVKTITTPGGNKTTFNYTNGDNVSGYFPQSGKGQEYFYDAAKRLVRTKHLSPGLPDIIYGYDKVGNLTSISTQQNGGAIIRKITREYDALNRQISTTDAAGVQIQHRYDGCGQVKEIIYPGNKSVYYKYDKAKRLRRVTDWAGRVTAYAYNAQDQITEVIFPNQTRRVFTYDNAALLSSRTEYDSLGGIILRFVYTFDANGKMATETTTHSAANWLPTQKTMTYGADNRLVSINGTNVTYDLDGNMTQGLVGGATTSIQWDGRNNLRQTGATIFSYDVQDRLIGWQDGSDTVSLSVIPSSGGSLLMQSDINNSTTQYVYGIGLAYEVTGDEIKVHHYNERGDSLAVTGNDGLVSGRNGYDPHGQVVQDLGATSPLLKFGALFGVIHAPGGLSYMRFRWYSGEMMRFLSMDSVYGDIDLPSTLNRYIYASNDPINFVDPEGELFWMVFVVAAIVGAAVSVAVEAISNAIQGKPHRWQDYLGAALGGALGGAVAVVCSICSGVVEGIAGELFTAAINGDAVDFGAVAIAGAGGLVGGVAGKGLGKAAGKLGRIGKKFLSKVGKGGKQITNAATGAVLKRQSASVTKKLLAESDLLLRAQAKKVLIDGAKDLSKAAPQAYLEDKLLNPLADKVFGSGSPVAAENGNASKYIIKATTSPAAGIGRGGEHVHYQRYLEALSAAGLPVPNPSIIIPSF